MSPEIKYSIPFNGNLGLTLSALKSGKVGEVYFAHARPRDFSAPSKSVRPNSRKQIYELLELCRKYEAGRNLLLNRSMAYCDNVKELLRSVKDLQENGGLTSLTVANPYVASLLKPCFPKIGLQASVFMNIDSLPKVREAIKMGLSEFCLDVSLNRNAEELERISRLKKTYPFLKIKLLANHGCYQHCFYAQKHADLPLWHEATSALRLKQLPMLGRKIDYSKCRYQVDNLADEIKRPYIRPEDVSFYEKNGLADTIKIAHRIDDTKLLAMKFHAYFSRSFKGDLFSIAPSYKGSRPFLCDNACFPKGFIEKVSRCGQACSRCRYCFLLASKVLKPKTQAV